jgi:hypothetical protein
LVIQPKAEKPDAVRGLLSEKEAADYLGVCRLTLLRLRKRKLLGCFRVGTRILYGVEEHIKPFLARDEQHMLDRRGGARRARDTRVAAPHHVDAAKRIA